jgi:hypothetical protein
MQVWVPGWIHRALVEHNGELDQEVGQLAGEGGA